MTAHPKLSYQNRKWQIFMQSKSRFCLVLFRSTQPILKSKEIFTSNLNVLHKNLSNFWNYTNIPYVSNLFPMMKCPYWPYFCKKLFVLWLLLLIFWNFNYFLITLKTYLLDMNELLNVCIVNYYLFNLKI